MTIFFSVGIGSLAFEILPADVLMDHTLGWWWEAWL
jgi:hypothetical protein